MIYIVPDSKCLIGVILMDLDLCSGLGEIVWANCNTVAPTKVDLRQARTTNATHMVSAQKLEARNSFIKMKHGAGVDASVVHHSETFISWPISFSET